MSGGRAPRALVAAASLLLGASALGAQAPRGAGETSVRIGTAVLPETVTVGQPFRVELRLRAPAGSKVEFPIGPDTAATIDLLDPKAVHDASDAGATDVTASYRMAAWDVGSQPIAMSDVVVTGPASS